MRRWRRKLLPWLRRLYLRRMALLRLQGGLLLLPMLAILLQRCLMHFLRRPSRH